jgi:mono/diheme cytochrome c family protein
MSDNQNKAVPGWVNFLFWGAIAAGILYAVFTQGFLNQSDAVSVRDGLGERYVVPTIDIIPVRNQAAIEAGAETYARVCTACHGVNLGKGNVGPSLIDAEWWHPPASETHLAKLVLGGISASMAKEGVPMPARGGQGLSNEEVWQIIYYISEENATVERDAVPNVSE